MTITIKQANKDFYNEYSPKVTLNGVGITSNSAGLEALYVLVPNATEAAKLPATYGLFDVVVRVTGPIVAF